MTAIHSFDVHNKRLLSGLLPKEGELPEAYFSIDPNDDVFNQPIPQKHDSNDKKSGPKI